MKLSIAMLISLLLPLSDSTRTVLPSLMYHELVKSIQRDVEYREELEISPSQLKEISEIAAPGMAQASRSKREKQQVEHIADLVKNQPSGRVLLAEVRRLEEIKGDVRQQSHEELSAHCRRELMQLLTPEQFDLLRPVALRLQFPTGLSPFSRLARHPIYLMPGQDGPLSHLVPSLAERAQLAPVIEGIKQSRQSKLDDLCASTAAEFIRKLPKSTQERFVQLIGNEWTPEIPLDNSIPHQSLPSLSSWNDSTLTDHVLHVPGVKEKLEITSAQLEKLRSIHEDYLSRFASGKPRNVSLGEFDNILNRSVAKQVAEVLNDQQLLTFARHDGYWKFVVDCRRPFARIEFVRFLNLSEEELDKIRNIAEKQYASYQKSVLRIEQEAFRAVVRKLPDDSKQRVQQVFGKTWPLVAPTM